MSRNVVPRVPHLGHFGYQNMKKGVQTNFIRIMKKHLPTNTEFLRAWNTFVWFPGYIFQGFSDPDPTWPPKPQKVKQMSPKGHQKVTRMTPETKTTQQKSNKHLPLGSSFSRNPARRNARSALHNSPSILN